MAENSGGAHCFKYGFTTNYVTGLEVVLPDGEVVQLGGKELDRPGYDLLGAFVGSEGTLGVATQITLRVIPAPERVRDAGRLLRRARARPGEAVSDIVAAGIVPAAIEMMDRLAIQAAEGAPHAGYPTRRGRGAAGRARRPEAECERALRRGRRALRAHGGATTIRVAAATRPSAR